MTLEDMLKNEMADSLTLVSKNANLKKQVRAVESTEAPDAFPFLEPDSIVLTMAMVFKNDPKGLCEFITGLSKRPCTAIAIKIGRFLDEIDEEVIKTADELKFPVFIIPSTETLGRVYHRLLAILWNVRDKELLEVLQTKRNLYRLFLNGATFRRMMNTISSMLQRHVALFDLLESGIYESGTATEEELEKALQVIKLLETRNVLWPAVKTVDGSQMIIYPIEFIRENTYFFVLFDNYPAYSMRIIEEILLVLGTMLYKNLFVIYNEIWEGNIFLKRLIQEDENNVKISQLLVEGREYGLRMSTIYQVVIGRFINLEKYQFNNIQLTYREEKYISSFHSLKKIFAKIYNKKLLIFGDIENWQYVLLIQGNCEKLDEELEYISERIECVLNEKITFFIGGMCQNIAEAASSYWELNGSINHMKYDISGARVVGYKAKNIEELLEEIPRNQSRKICEETLKELAYPNTDFHKELRRTLEVYLECGCSIAETSKKLFIHRNTVRYRIRKCEEILSVELTPSELHFDLQLCLKLSR